MRYKLMFQDREVGGQRRKTKQEIETWIDGKTKDCGLDWRVGYTVKFKTSSHVFVWRHIKNDETVAV